MRQGTDAPESILSPTLTRHEELARLDEAIKTLFLELMDCGGTTPPQTLAVLREEAPGLCRSFDDATLLACCRRIHLAEAPEQSERFQERFKEFNERYFAGALPPYEVRVVFDVNYWANEYFAYEYALAEPSSGYHDQEKRRIFLRYGSSLIEGMLLHEMAHAAAGGDHGEEWLGEMWRLRTLGAPVCAHDLDPDDPRRTNSPHPWPKMRLTANDVIGT